MPALAVAATRRLAVLLASLFGANRLHVNGRLLPNAIRRSTGRRPQVDLIQIVRRKTMASVFDERFADTHPKSRELWERSLRVSRGIHHDSRHCEPFPVFISHKR